MFRPFLQGKVALVTGSTYGIGHCIAAALLRVGASVVVNGRHPQPQDSAAIEALRAQALDGAQVLYMGADMQDRAALKTLATRIETALGPVDILVNNAGIQHVCSVEHFPLEAWDRVLAVNLTAPFILTQQVLPGMRARNYGRIVNISSIQGLIGSADKSAYNSAKHGLIGLTKVVALETAAQDITCNAVCPGFTRSPLLEKQVQTLAESAYGGDVSQAFNALIASRVPSMKTILPEDIAHAVVYLCSPAATQVKGTTMVVDGGLLAQ